MVYEYLLLVENTHTQTKNDIFDDTPFFPAPGADHRPLGTLQGVSLWNVKYNLETALFFVNREVSRETSEICRKNTWIRISVNVDMFSAQLQVAGFNILAPRPHDNTRYPALALALDVNVIFDSRSPGQDDFFCLSVDLPGLCRALSLTSGFENASLKFTMAPCPANSSVRYREAQEWRFLGPFTELFAKPRSLDVVGIEPTRIDDLFQNFHESARGKDENVHLTKVIPGHWNESEKARQKKRWQEAHDEALTCLGLINVVHVHNTVRRRLYSVSADISDDCLFNIIRTRLKLGDVDGADKMFRKLSLRSDSPERSLFIAHLLEAMVNAAKENHGDAISSFGQAHLMFRIISFVPSDPNLEQLEKELKEELNAFEKRLMQHTAVDDETRKNNQKILQEVRKLLSAIAKPPATLPGDWIIFRS